MNIAKNMESIFVTVALFGVSLVWIAPSSDYTEIQVNANVTDVAPATHAAV